MDIGDGSGIEALAMAGATKLTVNAAATAASVLNFINMIFLDPGT